MASVWQQLLSVHPAWLGMAVLLVGVGLGAVGSRRRARVRPDKSAHHERGGAHAVAPRSRAGHEPGTFDPALPVTAPARTHGHGNGATHARPARTPSAALSTERVIDCMRRLGSCSEPGPLLEELAAILGREFACRRVLVRAFNGRTRLYEARASYGLDPEAVARASTLDVDEGEFTGMTARAARIAGGWRVSASDTAWPDRLHPSDEAPSAPTGWSPTALHDRGLAGESADDHLVLPLLDERDDVIGYVCAVPSSAAIFDDEAALTQWRMIARVAAAELRSARLRTSLQRRDVEYAIVSEQLREWQSMRDNFVSNVSHELRTPLTSIKAYTETLVRGFDDLDAATAREFIEVVQHEAERLEQVFDDLLDVAHLEGRGRRVARDRIDLRGLVRDVARDWHERYRDRGVDLRVYGGEEELWIQGDVDGIRQVVDSLLSNGLKFTPEGGRVRVDLQEDAGTVQLSVDDDGVGIPEHERLRIFERFYQIDCSSTRAYGGQGLGLALCREIVGWHHGRIWVEDGEVGGSRFVVSLPVRGFLVRQHTEDAHASPAERAQWESFLQLAIHLTSELMGTRVASIMLVDELHDVLRIEAAVGLEEDVVQSTMVGRGEGVAGAVWRDGSSILVPDLDRDAHFRHLADDLTYRPRSLLSVPLRGNERVVGVLNVNTKHNGSAFDDDDRLLLEALAERILVALDNFERYRTGFRRLASVESGVRAMLDIGRERRTRLRDALARVGVETGRRLGLDETHLRALSYALRTYDLGLAQVSAQVLRKTTPLTSEEREHIDQHARLGAELVAELEPSPVVRKMILHHHENIDGSGYPEGLRGEAIPVGARIVRLVDAFSALLHERPFRKAVEPEQAEALLRDGIDRSFCPRVTPVFLDVIARHRADLHALLAPPSIGVAETELDAAGVNASLDPWRHR